MNKLEILKKIGKVGLNLAGVQAGAGKDKVRALEAEKELLELRKAQFGLRMQLATQSLTKNSEIQRVKREIARVHTVLTEKSKASKQ